MSRFSFLLPLAAAAAVFAGQSGPSDAAPPAAKPAQTAPASQTQQAPPQTVDDDSADGPQSTPPTDEDKRQIAQQQTAVASTRKVPAGALSLAASTGKNILVVRVNGKDVRTFHVSVGTKAHPTPSGHFGIRHIVWNPGWHPPKEKWAKGKEAKKPGDPDNPMKIVKLFFQEPDYYIHGTDKEDQLGGAASHGCIRMAQGDVYELARLLQERGGAAKPAEWYQRTINRGLTANVMLPKAIPIVIGK
jgi:lipoprotein-anchoring transpeptidase ErfK/SrfK